MKSLKLHCAILMNQIPVEGPGILLFTLGTLAVFLIGGPEIQQCWPIAVLGGLVVVPGRYYWNN